MIFQSKMDRANQFSQEQNAKRREKEAPDVYLPGEDGELPEVCLQDEMEKGDLFAMIVAGFLTIWPAVLVVLGVLMLAGYFFIMH